MTEKQIGIVDLLGLHGFDTNCKSKLVRHQDRRFDVQELIRDEWLDLYQAHQSKDIFKNCDYIITFCGDGGRRAKLLGVYRVVSGRNRKQKDLPKGTPFEVWRTADYADGYFYDLELQEEYADLQGRVVVDWGPATISWHQHTTNKPVIEIYPPGRKLTPFTDYLDFTLSFDELKSLVENPEAHRDWKTSLSSVSGVYMILVETTGKQYVGSAYGLSGIWGRWSTYAKTKHGNNKLLKELVADDENCPKVFRFSVLQVLPKSTKKAEVIRWENQYKRKLGSRATGLNASEA